MTKTKITEKKVSKDVTCGSGKIKNTEITEFTNGSSFKGNTVERRTEPVNKNNSKRNLIKRNSNLITSVLFNFYLRNIKIAPIVNSCIKETLLRTDVNILEILKEYYTKG